MYTVLTLFTLICFTSLPLCPTDADLSQHALGFVGGGRPKKTSDADPSTDADKPSEVNQKIPVPTYFDTYPGASFVNGADGQGAAVATALVAAASDIGAVLMSKKLHNARQQYLKSLKEDKKGTL